MAGADHKGHSSSPPPSARIDKLENEAITTGTKRIFSKLQDFYLAILSLIYQTCYILLREYKKQLERLAVAAWMFLMPLSAFLQLVTIFCPLLWPYWLWIQIDKAPERGGRVFTWVRSLFIWILFRDYFPVKLHKEQDLPADRNYLFAAHPHGILPLGLWCNFSTEANNVGKVLPGLKIFLCTLPSNFKIPFLRELLMALGCIPVSEESIRYCLTYQKSGNVVIDVVGGSAESLDQKPGTTKLTLKRRTGFLRLAIETQSDLVPVFTFGENDIFEQKDNPQGSWLRLFQEAGKKFLGMSPTLFWGAPLRDGETWGFLPMRQRVTSVVGPPITVPKMPEGADEVPKEMIDELREVYIRELKALFERHRHEYGRGEEKDMEIIA